MKIMIQGAHTVRNVACAALWWSVCAAAWAAPSPTATCRAFFTPIYQQARTDGTVDRSGLTTAEAVDAVLDGYCRHALGLPGPTVFQQTDFFWTLTMEDLAQQVQKLPKPQSIPDELLRAMLTPAAASPSSEPTAQTAARRWARLFLSHPALTAEQRAWIERQFPGLPGQVQQQRQWEWWLGQAQRDPAYLRKAMATAPDWVLHMYQTQQLNLLPQDIQDFPYQPEGSALAGSNLAIAVLKSDVPRLKALLVRAAQDADLNKLRQLVRVYKPIPDVRVFQALMASGDADLMRHALTEGAAWVNAATVNQWLRDDQHVALHNTRLKDQKLDATAATGYMARGVARLLRDSSWEASDEGRDFLDKLETLLTQGLTLPRPVYEEAFMKGSDRLMRVLQAAHDLPPPLVQRCIERLQTARTQDEIWQRNVATLAANRHVRWTDEQIDACLDIWNDGQASPCIARPEFRLTPRRLAALLRALDQRNPRNPNLYTAWETLVPVTWYELSRKVGPQAIQAAIDTLLNSQDQASMSLLAANTLIPLSETQRRRLSERLTQLARTRP